MNNPNTQESPTPANGLPIVNRLLLILLMIAPLLYIIMLLILDQRGRNYESIPFVFNGTLTLVDFLVILFALVTAMMFILTYAYFLPIARKEYNPQKPGDAFFKFFLVFALSEAIVIYGLVLAILAWIYTGIIYWSAYWLFMAVGEGHMIYLYLFQLPSTYRISLGIETNTPTEGVPGSKEINRPLMALGIILLVSIIVLLYIGSMA